MIHIYALQFPNGSDHGVIACYLGLYEEGEVEHINGVWSSSLDLQLVGHTYKQDTRHMRSYACAQNPYKNLLAFPPLAFLIASQVSVDSAGYGWVGPLICSTSPSSYNPK